MHCQFDEADIEISSKQTAQGEESTHVDVEQHRVESIRASVCLSVARSRSLDPICGHDELRVQVLRLEGTDCKAQSIVMSVAVSSVLVQ